MRRLLLTGVIAGTVGALGAVEAVPARAQNDATGAPIIQSVTYSSRNVFDPEEAENNFLFRMLNALHIRTRRYVVNQEVLFNVGEPFDSARIAETERNLRALKLFRDVEIDTTRVDGRLNVNVDAADAWTTTLQADARSTGGQFVWGLGLKEKNILGTATLFRAKFRREVDRNSFTLEARQDRLLGTRAGFHVRWDNLSDGTKGVWSAGLPFRAFANRTAAEISGEWAAQRVLQFRDGNLFQEFYRRLYLQNFQLAYAPYARETSYLRLGLVGQVKREEYFPLADTASVIPDTVTATLGLAAEWVKARFQVTHYYLAFARDVDVDLSTRAAATVWLAPAAFGYPSGGIGLSVHLQAAAVLGRNFARLEVQASKLFTESGPGIPADSGQIRAQLTAVSLVVPRSATVLRVEVGSRRGTPPSEEFDVGFDRGLRRFAAHSFTGVREAWVNVEQRVFLVDEFLHLFGIGAAAYFDYGGAWFTDQPARYGGAVGFGLRITSTRAGAVTMGRLDLAYRYGDGFEGNRWVFSFGRNVTF